MHSPHLTCLLVPHLPHQDYGRQGEPQRDKCCGECCAAGASSGLLHLHGTPIPPHPGHEEPEGGGTVLMILLITGDDKLGCIITLVIKLLKSFLKLAVLLAVAIFHHIGHLLIWLFYHVRMCVKKIALPFLPSR